MRITVHVATLDEAEEACERFLTSPHEVEIIVAQPVTAPARSVERQPLKQASR